MNPSELHSVQVELAAASVSVEFLRRECRIVSMGHDRAEDYAAAEEWERRCKTEHLRCECGRIPEFHDAELFLRTGKCSECNRVDEKIRDPRT